MGLKKDALGTHEKGPHHVRGETLKQSQLATKHSPLMVGRITLVKPYHQTVNIDLGDQGQYFDVPITYAGTGPGSGVRYMPEAGASVLCLPSAARTGINIVGFLTSSLDKGPKYLSVATVPEQDPAFDPSKHRTYYQHRLLREGETEILAKQGASVYLSEDVETATLGYQASVLLREDDGSYTSTAKVSRQDTSGVTVKSGLIRRDALGNQIESPEAEFFEHHNGTEAVYISTNQYSTTSFLDVEHRIEVSDKATSGVPEGDVSGSTYHFLGHNVGNDPSETMSYGSFLKPMIFPDGRLLRTNLAFTAIGTLSGQESMRGSTYWGVGYSTSSYLGVDRAGTLQQYLGEGTGINFGISRKISAAGSSYEYWGKDASLGVSLNARYEGGIKLKIGSSSDNPANITPQFSELLEYSSLSYRAYGPGFRDDTVQKFDDLSKDMSLPEISRYSSIERFASSRRTEVRGRDEHLLLGGVSTRVRGDSSTRVAGTATWNTAGDIGFATLSNFHLAAKGIDISALSSKAVYGSGDVEKKLMLGSDKTTILVGDRKTDIGTGSFTTDIAAGSFATTVGAGSWSTSVTAGSATLSATSVNVSATSTATIGGTTVAVNATDISINAPSVSIGVGLKSGVLTSLNHPCFVTGAIAPGSFTVRASA